MRTKIRAVLALPPAERRALRQAWLYLLLVDAALRLIPLPRVQAGIASLRRARRGGSPPLPADRLSALLATAARHHLHPMRCLPRALALQALLARQGEHAELRIGVARQAGTLQAHAWLERNGLPLGEEPGVGDLFAPLAAAPAPAL